MAKVTKQDIDTMKRLKQIGYSDRKIADIFNIAKSTVWDNIHDKYGRKIVLSEYRKIAIAIEVIKLRKHQGKNSMEVSHEFNIPLEEVNSIWGTIAVV